MVCSNCADNDLSRVTAVQPSSKILVSYRPAFTMGSMVKIMPGLQHQAFARFAKVHHVGRLMKHFTNAVAAEITHDRKAVVLRRKTEWRNPTSPKVAPGFTAAMPRIMASYVTSTKRRALIFTSPTKYMRLESPNQPSKMGETSMFTMSPSRKILSPGMPWQTTWLIGRADGFWIATII